MNLKGKDFLKLPDPALADMLALIALAGKPEREIPAATL